MMARSVKEGDTEQELRNAFGVFDKDNSGTISASELRQVLASLGENLTDEELDDMLKMADKNGDGTIDCRKPSPLGSELPSLVVGADVGMGEQTVSLCRS